MSMTLIREGHCVLTWVTNTYVYDSYCVRTLCTDLGDCNTYVYDSYWVRTLCTDLGDCNTYVYDSYWVRILCTDLGTVILTSMTLLGKDIVY